jgi:hypothetical protein
MQVALKYSFRSRPARQPVQPSVAGHAFKSFHMFSLSFGGPTGLLYVGITRARRQLYLATARIRG